MSNPTTIRKNFRSAIRRGTGAAYLLMKSNPDVDFSNDIIKACLTNFAYDGQCESSRGFYLFELISLSKKKEKILQAILWGLATTQGDTWALTQLFDLAKISAQQGNAKARQTIYDRFSNQVIAGSDWVGSDEILELDGLDGAIFIADKLGRELENNPDDWQDDFMFRQFQDENPDIDVFKELEAAAANHRFIGVYLARMSQNQTEVNNYRRKAPKYKNIVEEVLTSHPYIRLYNRKLTDDELNMIAVQLVKEKDKQRIEKLLEVFTKFKFPLDNAVILQLAKQKKTSKNNTVTLAIKALKYLKSDDIRTFALERINTARRPEEFTSILVSNYEVGDHILLADLARKSRNEYQIENLVCSYIDIYRANKKAECKEPIEVLYDKMNCGIHRTDLLEILLENNVLSSRITEEIYYDCSLESRALLDRKP